MKTNAEYAAYAAKLAPFGFQAVDYPNSLGTSTSWVLPDGSRRVQVFEANQLIYFDVRDTITGWRAIAKLCAFVSGDDFEAKLAELGWDTTVTNE